MDCKTCKDASKNLEPVPYLVHEAEVARLERVTETNAKRQKETIKKLWIALLVSLGLWAATVGGVIYYESQFVDESWTYEADTDDGGNAIVNSNGEVYYYGESESDTP